ncbi:hypothetical protein DFP93_102355 [Aneurinibacillus soli]|uniref:Uncharacterized protein n=1 Tax=Aneurinibacillus soli TaxID=1500254 RepID=A0A0U5BB10_9BACL|nr:hypothetical protein [Aneurinibacillus soli]PYE63668.1 hypothetical protein DFP93_102355 [Aneurinibacillus soli]BAU27399.1 hypothetical protein CB4_01573 [Aneurinibacillus soli]
MRGFLYAIQFVFSITIFTTIYAMARWQASDMTVPNGRLDELGYVAKHYPSTILIMGICFCYILFSVFLIFNHWKWRKPLNFNQKGLLHVCLGLMLSIISFFLIASFTKDLYINSKVINHGATFIYLTLFIFVYFLVSLAVYSHALFKKYSQKINILFILMNFSLLGISIVGEAHLVKHRLIQLGGPSILTSQIFNLGWFNQYTNILYFNIYTFLIGTCITLTVCGIYYGFYARK